MNEKTERTLQHIHARITTIEEAVIELQKTGQICPQTIKKMEEDLKQK